jgi:hypothetical protein
MLGECAAAGESAPAEVPAAARILARSNSRDEVLDRRRDCGRLIVMQHVTRTGDRHEPAVANVSQPLPHRREAVGAALALPECALSHFGMSDSVPTTPSTGAAMRRQTA